MNLFIALGMEMGSWTEQGERQYYVMLQNEKINLSKDQYDLWILAQRAAFTPERAAEFLSKDVVEIEENLKLMEQKGTIIFWTQQFLTRLNEFTLTPRGNAGNLNEEGKQMLYGYVRGKAIEVDAFAHNLWMMSNAIIPLNKVIDHLANRLQLSVEQTVESIMYWIPYLIRHGLVVLNVMTSEGR